jgi:hypothetical protein
VYKYISLFVIQWYKTAAEALSGIIAPISRFTNNVLLVIARLKNVKNTGKFDVPSPPQPSLNKKYLPPF